jgi:predicted ArsR family transcriptional regulator
VTSDDGIVFQESPNEGTAVERSGSWTFLTNHGHVIVFLSREPEARVRDIAATVGITERATQAILADLERGGYVTRTRVGRRNTYQLHDDRPLRHPAEADHEVGELVRLFDEATTF